MFVNLFQGFGSGFPQGGVCSQISSLVSLDFWSLMAFDMPLLSPTTFRSVPALLLSGSAGWFVARGPFRSRRATPLQSPKSCITFVDDYKGQRKAGEDQFYHLLGFSEWTMDHLVWLSVQMKQDENFNEPPAEEQAHWETSVSWLHTCNLTIPIPPTVMDGCCWMFWENNCWDL